MTSETQAAVKYNVTSARRAPECIRIHDKVIRLVNSIKPKRILDIGCGAGDLTSELLRKGYSVLGLEPTDLAEVAREKCGHDNIVKSSCYEDYDELTLGKFDLVVASEVIEHLYLPRELVGFARKALLPNGKILLTSPHYGSYWRNLCLSLFNRWDYHHTPLWDGGHVKFFSPKTLSKLLREGGFSVVKVDSVPSRRAPVFPMSMILLGSLDESN